MTDDTITPDNTLNCSANPLPNPTVEQSYYRRFHARLRSHGAVHGHRRDVRNPEPPTTAPALGSR